MIQDERNIPSITVPFEPDRLRTILVDMPKWALTIMSPIVEKIQSMSGTRKSVLENWGKKEFDDLFENKIKNDKTPWNDKSYVEIGKTTVEAMAEMLGSAKGSYDKMVDCWDDIQTIIGMATLSEWIMRAQISVEGHIEKAREQGLSKEVMTQTNGKIGQFMVVFALSLFSKTTDIKPRVERLLKDGQVMVDNGIRTKQEVIKW